MQTLIAICLGIFLSFPAYAQKLVSDPLCANCISQHDPEAATDQEKCISSLCPTMSVSDDEVTALARKQSETDPEYLAASKLILDVLVKQVKDRRTNDVFLLQAIRAKTKITDPMARMFARLIKTADSPSKYIKLDENNELDSKATTDAMLADGKSMADAELFSKFLLSYLSLNKDPSLPFSDFQELKATLSEQELKQRFLTGLESLHEAQKQLSALTGLPLDVLYPNKKREENQRQIEQGLLSEARFDDMKNDFVMAKLKFKMFSNPKEYGVDTKAPIDLREVAPKDIESRLEMQIAVADRILAGDFKKNPQPYYEALDDAYQKCDFALREGYAMSPDTAQLTRFKKAETQYRREYAGLLKRFLSAHSAAELGKLVPKWKVTYPPERKQFISSFNERLHSEEEEVGTAERAPSFPSGAKEIAILELASNDDLKDNDEYFDSLKKVCTSEVPQAYGDQAATKRETLTASARTVIRPEFSKQILFHEYSHLLSTAIRKSGKTSTETRAWYNDFRKCLDKQRGAKKHFTEEDFAQSMAVAMAPESQIFLCEIGSILFKKEKYFTLTDSESDKEHSGPVYNLVLGLLARGQSMPETCRRAFAAKGEKDIPESCFGAAKSSSASAVK